MDNAVQILLFLTLCGCVTYVNCFSNFFASKERGMKEGRYGFRAVLLRTLLNAVIMAAALAVLIFG